MIDTLKLFTIEETAKILKVSGRQVWRYIESKKLKVIKLSPKTIRIFEKDLEDFVKKHKK